MKFKSIFLSAMSFLAIVSCNNATDPVGGEFALSKPTLTFDSKEHSETVSLTAGQAWEVKVTGDAQPESWLTVTPPNGNGTTKVTVKVTANPNNDRTASVVFYGDKAHQATLSVSQKGEQGEAGAMTIAEFLKSKPESAVKLAGVIGDLSKGDKYYGFTLKDATGTVSCPFPSKWDSFKDNLHTGDAVTLEGPYEFYEQKSQDQVKNANILTHTPASVTEVTKKTVAEFLAAADPFTIYRLEGTIGDDLNTTYGSFTLTDATGSVKVYSVNNVAEYKDKLKVGATVVLRGAYQLYNGTTPEVIDCDYESIEGGSDEGKITGDSIIGNGGFETWSGNLPESWGGVPTTNGKKIEKSTDAHSGSYSVLLGSDSGKQTNYRLTSKTYNLKAGTYQICAYAKGEGDFQLGYVTVDADGKATSSSAYKYGGYVTAVATDWTEALYKFTLTQTTKVSFVLFNSKNNAGKDLLFDDFSVVTKDGGISEDGDTPPTPVTEPSYPKLNLTNFVPGKYAISYVNNNKYYIMKNEVKSSYYVTATEFDLCGATVPAEENLFLIEKKGDGYTIKNNAGKYVAITVSGTHYNLIPSQDAEYVWTFAAVGNGIKATGANSGEYYLSYQTSYVEFTTSKAAGYEPVYYLVTPSN